MSGRDEILDAAGEPFITHGALIAIDVVHAPAHPPDTPQHVRQRNGHEPRVDHVRVTHCTGHSPWAVKRVCYGL
jgi:hypothetical protein